MLKFEMFMEILLFWYIEVTWSFCDLGLDEKVSELVNGELGELGGVGDSVEDPEVKMMR